MIYIFGGYELDTRLYELRHAGTPLKLEPQVFNLLAYLIQHRDHVVTRQELFEHLWPHQFVSEVTLTHRLMEARKMVGDSGRAQRLIQTIHGRGYRFIGAVEERAHDAIAHALPAESSPLYELEEQRSGRTALESSATPSSFALSPTLAALLPTKLRTFWSALAGERKHVTVLFCTVANAADLTEQLSPEVMHTLLHRFFALALHEVHRYEGTVTQFLGDGFMALFGVPLADEEHARQAVRAALGIQQEMSQGVTILSQQYGVDLAVRIGLHTGLVIVGTIEENGRVNYTTVGDTITLVTRVHQATAPGTIQLTEPTYKLVRGYFQCVEAGLVEMKDTTPVRVYQVMGERSVRSRLDVARERGLTRLVGREQELALLHDCLARVEAGHGQVVNIVGEPGLGKSRLIYEFHSSVDHRKVIWLEGHCLSHGQATPYRPILEILRLHFQLKEEDHPQQIQAKLRQGIRQLDPGLEVTLPFLEALFSLPGADHTLRHLDLKERRRETFEAVRALFFVVSQRQPLVLCCENLHWIDQSSEECLRVVIEGVASMPVLVLTTHRPGYTVRWADRPYYTQIALDLLSALETETMVAHLLENQDLPPDLLRFIQEKTEGNPLFIEEVTQALLERRVLIRHNSGVHWTSAVVTDFPATMQDIMRARIDQLDEPVKRIAQRAAVIGREFGLRLLTQLSADVTEVQQALEALKRLELIYETRVFPEPTYRFKHVVIQDVAYQSLLEQQRQEMHGAIGRAMEDLFADRREEQAALLAYHYAHSMHHEQAIAYALLAGDQATRLYAHAEATTYYTQVLTIARALPPSPEAYRAQIDATLKLATVGTTRADLERDQKNLEQSRVLAEALQDDSRLAQVLYWLGRIQHVLGNPSTAIAYAQKSLEIADRLGDESLATPPVNLMGRASWFQSDFQRAAQMLARSAEQMHRLGNKSEEATASGFAGLAFGHIGEFEKAFPYLNQGIRLAQEIQNPLAEAAAYHYRAMVHDQHGAWREAIKDCEEARRIAEEKGDLLRVYLVKIVEGRAYMMNGNPDQGQKILAESLALGKRLGTKLVLAWLNAYLAACLLALNQPDPAPPLCHEAIRLAEESGDRYAKALAHRALAEALFTLNPTDPQQAERFFLEALYLQQEIGAKPELARTYVRYAHLLQRQGKTDQAKEYLVQAGDLFRQMGVTWDLIQAEQVLGAMS
jgi:class 3 adenylate cyclase/tetratricopeptide (TPR) repeat protein